MSVPVLWPVRNESRPVIQRRPLETGSIDANDQELNPWILTTMKSTRNNPEETMKVHTLAATDTQTNIREVLTQTVQRRFSDRLRRLISYTALLLGTMRASASWADNCTCY